MARTAVRRLAIAALLTSFSGTAVLAAVTITGNRVVGQTLLAPTTVSPKFTFLRTDPSDTGATAAVPFSLATLGIAAGDVITLLPLGDFRAGASLADDAIGTIAVFSSSATLLAGTNLDRVPGALDAQFVSPVTTANTSSGLATDIAQDFNGLAGVRVPAGATHLFFAANNSFYGDNDDPDGDFQLEIIRPDAIGASGVGTLSVDTAGGASTFSVRNLRLGGATGASGTATVDGAGARIEASFGFTVGASGTGVLTVRNAGGVETQFVNVARNDGTGTVTVTGVGSEIAIENVDAPDGAVERLAASMRIGRHPGGAGTVEVSAGAQLRIDGKSTSFPSIILGERAGSSGLLRVTGKTGAVRSGARVTGSTSDEPFVDVGQSGDGQLIVEDEGEVNVVGPQAALNVSRNKNSADPVTPAAIDEGTGVCTGTCVQVLSGGELSITGTGAGLGSGESFLAAMNVARDAGSDAIVRINGAGSKLAVEGDGSFINVGLDGQGELRIQDGGVVDPVFTNVGQNTGSNGRLALSGSGSLLRLEGKDLESDQAAFMTIGRRGAGVAELSGGAAIEIRGATDGTFPGFTVGREDGSSGTLTLDGGSRIDIVGDVGPSAFGISGFVAVGRGGDGTVTVRGASTITNDAEGTFRVGGALPGGNSPGRGVLTVTGNGSRVDAGRQFLVAADPQVNGNVVSYLSSGVPGSAEVSSGATIAAQIIQVGNGGALRGDGGTYEGPVTAFDGGVVDPGTGASSVGGLSITGTLTLNDGTLEIDVSDPDTFDTVSVSGAAALGAGTVVLKFAGGFHSSEPLTLAFLSAASIDASGTEIRLEGVSESATAQLSVQGGALVAQVTGAGLPPVFTPALQLLLED